MTVAGGGPSRARETVTRAADRLERAASTHTPCAPVRDLIGAHDVDTAYAVQRELSARRAAAGGRRVGRKIGLTSAAVQTQLGVNRPDFGVLFADMDVSDDEEVESSRLLQGKVEAEIAFVLADDLIKGPFDDKRIRASIAAAVAALEIVDSRIEGWDITFGDTVADNASSGLFVLARTRVALDDIDPAAVEMTMRMDGASVSRGSGADCLGDPLMALAWLARTAAELGDPLRAGDVVLSGALGPMVPVQPGSVVTAELGPLGTVSARFSTEGLA